MLPQVAGVASAVTRLRIEASLDHAAGGDSLAVIGWLRGREVAMSCQFGSVAVLAAAFNPRLTRKGGMVRGSC